MFVCPTDGGGGKWAIAVEEEEEEETEERERHTPFLFPRMWESGMRGGGEGLSKM